MSGSVTEVHQAKPAQIFVLSNVDGNKYKLLLRNGMGNLTTAKIKHFIEKSAGIACDQQLLSFNGVVLRDSDSAASIGLFDGAILRLHRADPCPSSPPVVTPVSRTALPAAAPLRSAPASPKVVVTRRFSGSGSGSGGSEKLPQPKATVEVFPTITAHVPHGMDVGVEGDGKSKLSGSAVRRRLSQYLSSNGEDGAGSRNGSPGPSADDPALSSTHEKSASIADVAVSVDPEPALPLFTVSAVQAAVESYSTLPGTKPRGVQGKSPRDGVVMINDGEEVLRVGGGPETPSKASSGNPFARRMSSSTRGSATSHTKPQILVQGDDMIEAKDVIKVSVEREMARLREENTILREKLQKAEQRVVNITPDYELEQRIRELERALVATRHAKEDVERQAEVSWRVKEEELVKELDILREERRRQRREHEYYAVEQRALVARLEAQLRQQRDEVQYRDALIQQLRSALAESDPKNKNKHDDVRAIALRATSPLSTLVDQALGNLTDLFQAPPAELDDKQTCVIRVAEDQNVLVTLDPVTERLYLYANVLNCLPANYDVRYQMYERLLEGALLGREMASGNVGICSTNEIVLMSTSVDLRHSDSTALAVAAQPFVESVRRWTLLLAQMIPKE